MLAYGNVPVSYGFWASPIRPPPGILFDEEEGGNGKWEDAQQTIVEIGSFWAIPASHLFFNRFRSTTRSC